MNVRKFLRLFVFLLLSAVILTSCFDTEQTTVDGIVNLSVPEPGTAVEEDYILRTPDRIADPADYTAWDGNTETGEESRQPTTPAAPKTAKLHFVAVGDNVIHGAVMEDGANHAKDGEDYNFNYIYDNVRDVISGADVAFVNQETLMGGKELGYTGYPNFNGPQEMGDALVKTGFDVVCIATNHMADYRDAGLRGTIDYWKKQSVTMIGGYENAADYENIRIYEKNGVRIALLAYTYDPYSTNGMKLSDGSELIVPIYNETVIRRQVASAKEVGDLVVVNMHWGTDSSFSVTEEQKQYAQLLADLGVDVIIGEHPHVLQPMGWLEGVNGNKTLSTYSIGNFVSTMLYDYFMVGGMLSFDIVKDADGTRIENPLLTPTVTYYDNNRANLSVYFWEDFTEELCASHGCNLNAKTSYAQMKKYITDAIPAEFLPDYLK